MTEFNAGHIPNDSRIVARAAVMMALSRTREEEKALKAEMQPEILCAAVDCGAQATRPPPATTAAVAPRPIRNERRVKPEGDAATASEASEAVAASPSGFTRRSFLMGLGATAAVVAGGGLVACAPQSTAAHKISGCISALSAFSSSRVRDSAIITAARATMRLSFGMCPALNSVIFPSPSVLPLLPISAVNNSNPFPRLPCTRRVSAAD